MRYSNPYSLGKKILGILLPGLLLSATAGAAELTLSIDDVIAPAFSARGIRLVLPDDGSADMKIAQLRVQAREFRNVDTHCAAFNLSSVQMSCRNGRLDAVPGARLDMDFDLVTRRLQLTLAGPGGESWQVRGHLAGDAWQVAVQLHRAQGKRLDAWLPVKLQGALNGSLHASGDATGVVAVDAALQLDDAGFSDASGLHAAEKLRGDVTLSARRKGTIWDWQGTLDWRAGEMFWQPLYLRGGHKLSAAGHFDDTHLVVEQAVAQVSEVGQLHFSADWDFHKKDLRSGTLQGRDLALDSLFTLYARPYLDKGTLSESALSGHADVEAVYVEGGLRSLRLVLHDAGIRDAQQRFALLGVNTDIDWRKGSASSAQIAFAGGALLGAPLGKGEWAVNMNGLEFDVPQASLPVLDGRLVVRDFHLHRAAADKSCSTCPPIWHWQFAASLTPVSMEELSVAAGWPKMLGTLAGRIPSVSYDGREIRVDGALLFNVFDGTVVATQIKLADAFGRAPRLYGNLTMRNLDLDLLTRTFSFGNMQGRLDVDVNDLQLQDWQPLRFDARVYSSAGNYPRKISQKAVQNISSLGGAGAAAAIQRSFLGFFKNFGYDSIGLSCVLRNGVCAMGGIDGSNGGSYAIIRGGGIPAISVMGYNRAVSWNELVTRLKRVTENNVAPIVQ